MGRGGIRWKWPDNDSDNSWWISNASSEDRSSAPTFLFRNYVTLQLQHQHYNLASTAELRREYEERIKNNNDAVDLLEGHLQIWLSVRGPAFDLMRRPTEAVFVKVREARAALVRMRDANEDAGDGTDIFCEQCIGAVDALKSLDFEVIRTERFKCTPDVVYEGLVAGLADFIQREEDAEKRRHAMLMGDLKDVNNDDIRCAKERKADKFGCNPDGYHSSLSAKPKGRKSAIQICHVVHIDEMRALCHSRVLYV